MQFYRYTLTEFIGRPVSPEGVSAYLKPLTCGNGKPRYYQALKALILWLYRNSCTQDKIIDKVPATLPRFTGQLRLEFPPVK